MVNPVHREPLSVRSAPPAAHARPAPAVEAPQDRVFLNPDPAASSVEDSPSRLSSWQGLLLLGLGALTLAGCTGIPGPAGPVLSHSVALAEKAPASATPSVFQNVFSKPYPRPAGWQDRSLELGATSYRTVVPPSGWTFARAGEGFQVTNDKDPSVYLQLQNVESASGLGDLESVLEARKTALREQGMDLREVDAASSGRDFFVSVNEFQRNGQTWRAELFVNGDVGTDGQNYSGTVTTIVYRAGEHADVFPTILQNTVKTIEMDMPLPIAH